MARSDEHDVLDHRPGRYYVSARDGERFALLLGPYDSHQEALDNVDRGRRLADDYDPRHAPWCAYGTCRLDDDATTTRALFGH